MVGGAKCIAPMLYLEIGKHFYKHAVEDMKEGKININGVVYEKSL